MKKIFKTTLIIFLISIPISILSFMFSLGCSFTTSCNPIIENTAAFLSQSIIFTPGISIFIFLSKMTGMLNETISILNIVVSAIVQFFYYYFIILIIYKIKNKK